MLFKSVFAESCAALGRAAVSESVLATLFFEMYRCCYGRHACLHTSCNGECKGKSSGSIQEDKASFLQVLLKTLQVVRDSSMSDDCSRVLVCCFIVRNRVPSSSCVCACSRVCGFPFDPGGMSPADSCMCTGTSATCHWVLPRMR